MADNRMNEKVEVNQSGGKLPRHIKSLLGFQLFNSVNFTIAIGTPMVLLAKFLGASEAMIGLLISLTPFFNILQLPAATFAERWGYKRLMLAGWRTRTYMLFLLAPLPFLAGKVPSPVLVTIMFVVMLGYNVSRGFSSGSWYPWLKEILPEKLRGTYFGIESRIINAGVLVTLLTTSMFIGKSAEGYQFCILSVVATVAGIVSLGFLKKAPGGDPIKNARDIGLFAVFTEILDVWKHKPFLKITVLASIHSFALSAIPGFLVVYLSDRFSMADNSIMFVSAASTAGSLIMAPALGRLSDRFGSRPIIRLGIISNIILILFWIFVGTRKELATVPVIACAYFLSGVAGSSYGIPMLRFVFGSCPRGSETVGFSVFQVVVSLFSGAAPIVWGILIEFMHSHSSLDPFVLMFVTSLCLLFAASVVLSSLKEQDSIRTVTMIGKLLIELPAKLVTVFRPEGVGEN